MNEYCQKLLEDVSGFLNHDDLKTEDELEEITKSMASIMQLKGITYNYTPADISLVVRKLLYAFGTTMEEDIMLPNQDTYRPWLEEHKATNPSAFYWDRYAKHLQYKGFHPPTIIRLDKVTDEVLDSIESPSKLGTWRRRGLVIGHVQSGKTANYSGLICKAADAGYKVIIVLAGSLNSLRSQTQERIDESFMGMNSSTRDSIGVGKYPNPKNRSPASFTDQETDFDIDKARSRGLTLNNLRDPAVFVIKKWTSTLRNLRDWLDTKKNDLSEYPLLLIDDEADYASVNTNKEECNPTAINSGIRKILDLFPRHSYVGYTATPFANIFIDAESNDNMLQEDLFPRDFIRCLGVPENYFGPSKIFNKQTGEGAIRSIDDSEDFIPLKHNKTHEISSLPPSLMEAIRCFFITCSLRDLRGQTKKHKSMMINCSRLNAVQSSLTDAVTVYVKSLQNACKMNHALETEEALKNPHIKSLHSTWVLEYNGIKSDWPSIQNQLGSSPLKIVILKVIHKGDQLNYDSKLYPSGRNIIAIGGLSLSRGITLEGLNISYFLRNTAMYDTLMQMGRWFGYRDGYEDMCRIYMHQEAIDWYGYISDATEELRNDLRIMTENKSKPEDFGLRVRSHPDRLLVTARNKMKSSLELPQTIDLFGRAPSTSKLDNNPTVIKENQRILNELIDELLKQGHKPSSDSNIHGPEAGYFWKGINPDIIADFVVSFKNHPTCFQTYSEPLLEQIKRTIKSPKNVKWDLLIKDNKDGRHHTLSNYTVGVIERAWTPGKSDEIKINKSRLGSTGDEKAGLSREQVSKIKSKNKGKHVADFEYRKAKTNRALIIIYILGPKGTDLTIPAYSICFPYLEGEATGSRNISYMVNPVYLRENIRNSPSHEEENIYGD